MRYKTNTQLGNHIKTRDDVDETKTEFAIHSIASFIECASVMAKLVRIRQAFNVKLEKIEQA